MSVFKRPVHELFGHVRLACWLFLTNSVAAIHVVPGPMRMAILRLAGLDVRTDSIRGGCHFRSPHVLLAPDVFINVGCFFEGSGQITIGSSTLLGPEVMILTSNHDAKADGTFTEVPSYEPVTIGSSCWIGARSVVLPGVTITERVIVAAGSVVTRSLMEPGVYGGGPARRVGGGNQ